MPEKGKQSPIETVRQSIRRGRRFLTQASEAAGNEKAGAAARGAMNGKVRTAEVRKQGKQAIAGRAIAIVAMAWISAGAAKAGEQPLYQPAPAWIVEAPLPDLSKAGSDTPAILIFDNQQRIEDGRSWIYSDTATRATSAEMLGQLATITLPWMPDKGDIIIHDLKILRGQQQIDLLASDKRFTVLRREQGLEQRMLTGLLSATMAVEGLQVGDVLRLRYSITSKDDALAGRAQSLAPVLTAPLRIAFGRSRAMWPTDSAVSWKALATGVEAKTVRKGDFTELSIPLPLPKQPDIPGDAPVRFRQPQILELSTFKSWPDVSQVMARLYRTDGLIAPGSPLEGALAEVKAGTTPLDRAQRALQIVQDRVRYLMVGMNGGNYVPQKPEETWSLRYGDCKAKTLLLLALLHGAGIEAEPVLASSRLGDIVPERLPSVAAFDHVLVRAVADGETLWLDGTGSGARIEDIHDTPPFRNVLPVRAQGAELMTMAMHRNARPTIDLAIEADESASVDLPSPFSITAVIRGPLTTNFGLMMNQLDKKQQDEIVSQYLSQLTGQAQFSDLSITIDETAASVTLKGVGAAGSSWRQTDKRMKRSLSRALGDISFSPDRARPAWASIPVATQDPMAVRYRLRLRLPDGGKGYTIEGDQAVTTTLAGRELMRTMTLVDGVITVDERMDATGAEIAVAQIPAERDKIAVAKAREPRIVAPATALREWDLNGRDPKGATQIAALETAFAKAIARDPDAASSYAGRIDFRRTIGDRKGAMADLDKAIKLAPDVDLYLRRAALRRALGDLPAALADAEAARELDPSSASAIATVAQLRAEKGDTAGAVALLDQRIELGGEARDRYVSVKADILGTYGEPEEALKLVDTLLEEKPGRPDLLNSRCWIKGTRSVMLDTALKDCTSAIELGSSTYQALDSRAMVWFRLGRYEEALQDLNAVLDASPDLAESRFMRAVVLSRLNRAAEGTADLAIARSIDPRIDSDYARFGIKP